MGNWFSSGNKPLYGWFKRQPVIAPPETTNLTGSNNNNSVPASYFGPYYKKPNTTKAASNGPQLRLSTEPSIQLNGLGNPQHVVNSSNSNSNGNNGNRNRSNSIKSNTTKAVSNGPQLGLSAEPSIQLNGLGNPQHVVNSNNSNTTYEVVNENVSGGGSRSKKNKNRRKSKRTRKNHKKGL
jgi:hypothetical protein